MMARAYPAPARGAMTAAGPGNGARHLVPSVTSGPIHGRDRGQRTGGAMAEDASRPGSPRPVTPETAETEAAGFPATIAVPAGARLPGTPRSPGTTGGAPADVLSPQVIEAWNAFPDA